MATITLLTGGTCSSTRFISSQVPGFTGDASGLTNIPPSGITLNNPNYAVITNGSSQLTTEQFLLPVRGGTGTDSSGATGVAKVAAGTWSYSTIVNADVSASAAIVDTKLATIATAGKVSNSATTASSANTANAVVSRDASGNFSSGNVTTTQLTQVANANSQSSIISAYVSTANATPTTLLSLPTVSGAPHGTTYLVRADISVGDVTGGVSTGTFDFRFKVKNIGGTLTLSAMSNLISILDAGFAPSVSVSSSGANALVQVTGIAATVVNWAGFFYVTQVNF